MGAQELELQHTGQDNSLLLDVVNDARRTDGTVKQFLLKALRAVRSHLGMDVAFISEFAEGRRIFRCVDSRLQRQLLREGDGNPLEESYCQRVVDGRLPELIKDAGAIPAALELPVTKALPVGAHLSVPLRLSDGTIYGTFCCFSLKPDYSLGERDLSIMRFFAELAADSVEKELRASREDQAVRSRIAGVIASKAITPVYQPIYDLRMGKIIAYEALSRFNVVPTQTPDVWFADAARLGLGPELEMLAVETAMRALKVLRTGLYLSVNVSPVLVGERLRTLLDDHASRVVLEITEHELVTQYESLVRELTPLRKRGVRIAVDDAGAGYASFRHILHLQPDFIKLDMTLTSGIDRDPARRALAAALITFAKETGSAIIAEGIETSAELDTLKALGIEKGQGYLLGKPGPLAAGAAVAAALTAQR